MPGLTKDDSKGAALLSRDAAGVEEGSMRRFLTVVLISMVFSSVLASTGSLQAAPRKPTSWRAYWRAQSVKQLSDSRAPRRLSANRALAGRTPDSDAIRRLRQISQYRGPTPAASEPNTQVEPDIAADPNDPNVLVSVFQQGRFPGGGSAAPGFATSHDGGRSWVDGSLPKLTRVTGGPYGRASDPVVTVGPDGTVYAQTLALSFNKCLSAVVVQRSTDGGLHFSRPVVIHQDADCNVFNDKNWITVDTFRGSPHYGRIYAAWDRVELSPTAPLGFIAPIVLKYSDDGGRTWSPLIHVSDKDANGIGALPIVQPNGDLTVVWDHYGATFDEMVSQTSSDGGSTFSAPVKIGDCACTEPPDLRTGALPSANVDPVTGYLYTTWQSTQFRSDGLNDIVLSRSVDGGKSWAPVKRITPPTQDIALDHFTPDVAAYDGAVHVIYGTRSARNGWSNRVRERYISSTNNGRSFVGQLTLGRPTNLRYAALVSRFTTKFLGDYVGIVATPDGVHPVWERAFQPPGGGHPNYHQTTWTALIRP